MARLRRAPLLTVAAGASHRAAADIAARATLLPRRRACVNTLAQTLAQTLARTGSVAQSVAQSVMRAFPCASCLTVLFVAHRATPPCARTVRFGARSRPSKKPRLHTRLRMLACRTHAALQPLPRASVRLHPNVRAARLRVTTLRAAKMRAQNSPACQPQVLIQTRAWTNLLCLRFCRGAQAQTPQTVPSASGLRRQAVRTVPSALAWRRIWLPCLAKSINLSRAPPSNNKAKMRALKTL